MRRSDADEVPELVPLQFHELLARQRIAENLTQRQIADGLAEEGFAYSVQAVGLWERGESVPRNPNVVYALERVTRAEPGLFAAALQIAPPADAAGPLAELARRVQALEDLVRDLAAELRGEQ